MKVLRETPFAGFMDTSLLRLFVALQMLDILIILFARVRHDPIRVLPARKRTGNGPRLCEEYRVVVCDRVLQMVVVQFLDAFNQVQLPAVLVAHRIEPAPLIDPDRIDDERVRFPMANGMTHKFGIIHNFLWVRPAIHVDHAVDRLVFEQEGDHLRPLDHLKRHWSRERPRGTDRQASPSGIVFRVHRFPSLQSIGRERRVVSECLSEIWSVLVRPETVQVWRTYLPRLNRKKQYCNGGEHKTVKLLLPWARVFVLARNAVRIIGMLLPYVKRKEALAWAAAAGNDTRYSKLAVLTIVVIVFPHSGGPDDH